MDRSMSYITKPMQTVQHWASDAMKKVAILREYGTHLKPITAACLFL